VSPNVLHRWRREVREAPGNAFPGNGNRRWREGKIAELERKIGQQTEEIDFLEGCLQRVEEARKLQVLNGNPQSTGIPVERFSANGQQCLNSLSQPRGWSAPNFNTSTPFSGSPCGGINPRFRIILCWTILAGPLPDRSGNLKVYESGG
jgi:hypothetical protein